jgi:hypothetical protein
MSDEVPREETPNTAPGPDPMAIPRPVPDGTSRASRAHQGAPARKNPVPTSGEGAHSRAPTGVRRRQKARSRAAARQVARAPAYGGVEPAPPPRRPTARRPVDRVSDSGLYFPWWSLVLMVGIVGVVAFGMLLAFTSLSEPQGPGNQDPRVLVVTSPPTLSQEFSSSVSPPGANQGLWPTPIPQAHPTPTVALPTPIPSPSLPPGEFVIGTRVQVVGVEGSGLNVRSVPGYSGNPRFLAYDMEVFVLVEGPQSADGLEWWQIEDPDDSGRFGWAARNYLMALTP